MNINCDKCQKLRMLCDECESDYYANLEDKKPSDKESENGKN